MIPDCCEQNMVWKNVKINDTAHMICFMKKNELWKVLLTNLTEIWMETLTDETILHKFQRFNPLLSLEAFDWKQLIMDMLNDIPKYINTCIVDGSTYRIELRKDKDFVKLKFSLHLLKETPQQFWENVTMPLCLTSMEMVRRYKILLDLVKQKDEEITEYKAVGAELIRKYIATKPFSEELFHIDSTASTATDFVKTLQCMFHFYNEINLPTSLVKIESKIPLSSTSDNNSPKIDENDSKDELVQNLRQDKLSEQEYSNIKECDQKAGPSSKTSTLKISSTSHRIHKLKKNKKTLNDFIS
ncbi:non-homologous end-joining factor 1-like [Nylanderia fulva]|uniref:non-homologous end-joining factor 1-like n=1 Tax=Nylanderia fulva TaxID=613905 RepID=UPI0010FB302E|nr:non-homologous end-joining factor 1-like [Nylanderia fulva]